jgi:hypothetical protein
MIHERDARIPSRGAARPADSELRAKRGRTPVRTADPAKRKGRRKVVAPTAWLLDVMPPADRPAMRVVLEKGRALRRGGRARIVARTRPRQMPGVRTSTFRVFRRGLGSHDRPAWDAIIVEIVEICGGEMSLSLRSRHATMVHAFAIGSRTASFWRLRGASWSARPSPPTRNFRAIRRAFDVPRVERESPKARGSSWVASCVARNESRVLQVA